MWAQMLLVRAAANVLREGVAGDTAKPLMSFLTSCVDTLRADLVLLEASRAVCSLPGFQTRDIQLAVEGTSTRHALWSGLTPYPPQRCRRCCRAGGLCCALRPCGRSARRVRCPGRPPVTDRRLCRSRRCTPRWWRR
jgi:hypothetical protein